MIISLSGLDMPWLDPAKRGRGRIRYGSSPKGPRSEVIHTPYVIGDIGETFSHADGKTYSSRKHWKDHLKAHGLIELGNDLPQAKKTDTQITEADVAEAYQMCEQGAGYEAPEDAPNGWEGDPFERNDD